jgi:hypothetical protein
MNKKAKISLFLSLVFMAFLAAGLVIAGPGGKGGGGKAKKECNDRIDNDGDGAIDLADAGCDNKRDKDETNCGDGVCEGGETSATCPADCGVADSCNDTDGGINRFLQGTVSGYQGGSPYSETDSCLNGTSVLREWFCLDDAPLYNDADCTQLNATGCSSGACFI